MLQMALHLTWSSRLWDTPRTWSTYIYSAQKKNETLTASMEIHKGAIFDRLNINNILPINYVVLHTSVSCTISCKLIFFRHPIPIWMKNIPICTVRQIMVLCPSGNGWGRWTDSSTTWKAHHPTGIDASS
jgi:hypothetical protein